MEVNCNHFIEITLSTRRNTMQALSKSSEKALAARQLLTRSVIHEHSK